MNLVANVFVKRAVRVVAGCLCGSVAGKHSDIANKKYDRRQIGVQFDSEVSSSGSWQPTCIYIRAFICKCLRACACMHARMCKCELNFGSTKVQIPVGFRVCKI